MKLVKKFIMAAILIFSCLPFANALETEIDQETGSEQEQETPTLDFLEFLGEWETDEGDWIAPEDLENMPLNETTNDDTKNK